MIKIKKRQGVFESNSSSMHSISIKNSVEKYETTNLTSGNIYNALGREYDNGYEVLNSWDEKLDYLIAEFYDGDKIKILKSMFQNYTGCELKYIEADYEYHDYSGLVCDRYDIDSMDDESISALFEELVFNSNVEFVLDNDC